MTARWAARLTGLLIIQFARLLTGVRATWRTGSVRATQTLYFANHTSHGDFVLVWTTLPPDLRATTRPVAAADYWRASALRRFIEKPVDDLELSAETATSILRKLAPDTPNTATKLGMRAKAADATVLLKKPAPKPRAVEVVAAPVQPEAKTAPPAQARVGAAHVWPTRTSKIHAGLGLAGKKRVRFVVLKNKALYVWKSEAHYTKGKEPELAFDCDALLRARLTPA